MPISNLQIIKKSDKILLSKLSRLMKYTLKDLQRDFPDEDACLQWLVDWMHPQGITCKNCHKVTKHHKLKSRRSYSCDVCGNHFHPTAGTVCHNSHVPLTDWFYAIYLMGTNKAGTPATQLQRELGCTYATAWRMMHQIRKMMAPSEAPLSGEVEIDETYLHPNVYKRSSAQRRYGFRQGGQRTGEILFGAVERGGAVKVYHVRTAGARVLMPLIEKHISKGTLIHTDSYAAYQTLPKRGYSHLKTNHSLLEFWREDSSTQNIENVWSTMKPRWKGTFKYISPQHLQAYANEFAFRYSNRNKPSMFWALMCQISAEKPSSDQ